MKLEDVYHPTIHMDELPKHLAVLFFGEAIVKQCYRKPVVKAAGWYEVTEVNRDTKTVTVTFQRD